MPEVRIDNQTLAVSAGNDNQLWVDLPEDFRGGSLEVHHGNGDVQAFELRCDAHSPGHEAAGAWAPVGE